MTRLCDHCPNQPATCSTRIGHAEHAFGCDGCCGHGGPAPVMPRDGRQLCMALKTDPVADLRLCSAVSRLTTELALATSTALHSGSEREYLEVVRRIAGELEELGRR